ncbi:hypothetical protein CgunFtcFv8_013475 [Champsocephalus gunnari]|uniref:Uncharacterized protein n=1 Tax=Champsocephalus gunnari TaxID=52237 RepID=A0AAN8DU84_CHAGU|nr:hypothetical protein CgunFtcFv8_013475 [Champsocephalus gunnari]
MHKTVDVYVYLPPGAAADSFSDSAGYCVASLPAGLLILRAGSFQRQPYGLVYGATVAIHITVLCEVVGINRLGSALGFFMLIRNSGGMLGPPIAGE